MSEPQRLNVGSVNAELLGVKLPFGLVLDAIRVKGHALDICSEPLKFAMKKAAILEVEIGPASLANFLESKSPGGLKNFSVEIRDGLIEINATKKVILDLKVVCICKLRIVESRQIWVDLERVEVMGGSLTSLIQSQLEDMNPVFDSADLPIPSTLSTVEMDAGVVMIRGTVSPPK